MAFVGSKWTLRSNRCAEEFKYRRLPVTIDELCNCLGRTEEKLGNIGRDEQRRTKTRGGNGYVMGFNLVIGAWYKPCVGSLKRFPSGGDKQLYGFSWVISDPSWASAAPLVSLFLLEWSRIVTLLLYA